MELENNTKVALIHDWLSPDFKGGAEKVLKEIENLLSKKDLNYELYTLVNHLDKNNLEKLTQKKIFTSLIKGRFTCIKECIIIFQILDRT